MTVSASCLSDHLTPAHRSLRDLMGFPDHMRNQGFNQIRASELCHQMAQGPSQEWTERMTSSLQWLVQVYSCTPKRHKATQKNRAQQ